MPTLCEEQDMVIDDEEQTNIKNIEEAKTIQKHNLSLHVTDGKYKRRSSLNDIDQKGKKTCKVFSTRSRSNTVSIVKKHSPSKSLNSSALRLNSIRSMSPNIFDEYQQLPSFSDDCLIYDHEYDQLPKELKYNFLVNKNCSPERYE